jgi:hypothetical protein
MLTNLATLKDDMTAFIEGHGMRRFHGHVHDDVQSVMWDPEDNPDAWKDFVELAKAAGAAFITMSAATLAADELDNVIDQLRTANYPNDEDIEDARLLRTHVGKTGYIQLGFPCQGTMFLYEISTDWYDRFQQLAELAEEFGGMVIDESGQDDER